MFRELGISLWRGSLGWDDYEQQPGRYDFGWLHRFIDLARDHRITLRPYLGYTPEWAAGGARDQDGDAWNQPPKDQRSWTAFVRALTAELRHHGNVEAIEIYNEQNVAQWWEGTVDEYANTLKSAAQA